MKTLFLACLVLLASMLGCGADPATETSKCTDGKCPVEDNSTKNKTTVADPMGAVGDYFQFEGYISPLNISVNGKPFVDSEEFYTYEAQRLRKEAAVDYPDYTVRLDANVGLREFKKDFAVFLVAANDIGVASESQVDGAGKFSFNLLADSVSMEDRYTLRASKRITVKLVKGNEEIRMCYNLYAESEVTLTRSVILRNFATTQTEFGCVPSSEGIQLPIKPNYAPRVQPEIIQGEVEESPVDATPPTPAPTPAAEAAPQA